MNTLNIQHVRPWQPMMFKVLELPMLNRPRSNPTYQAPSCLMWRHSFVKPVKLAKYRLPAMSRVSSTLMCVCVCVSVKFQNKKPRIQRSPPEMRKLSIVHVRQTVPPFFKATQWPGNKAWKQQTQQACNERQRQPSSRNSGTSQSFMMSVKCSVTSKLSEKFAEMTEP